MGNKKKESKSKAESPAPAAAATSDAKPKAEAAGQPAAKSATPKIAAALVKELREKTGAGMMDCKKALAENDGDPEKAAEWLRQKGITSADKKQVVWLPKA